MKNIDKLAKKYRITRPEAIKWIKWQTKWRAANDVKVNKDLEITPEQLQELSMLYDRRLRTIDNEKEFDIHTMSDYVGSAMSINALAKLTLTKDFPAYYELGSNRKRVWDKAEVIKYFGDRFCKNTMKARHSRKLSLEASTIVYFCTGRYWRYGEQVTTQIHHAKFF